jgi:alpha,alpha-trehalose phosphorylase
MRSPVTPDKFDAVLFDLDGVLTTTATLHEAAWRSTFDAFLDEWDAAHGTSTARFEAADYAAYVDGKPRQDGVRDFLEARGITLPPGTHDEPPSTRTVWGLGNLKQERVVAELAAGGAEVFPGSVAWVRELREAGLKTAVVSSSQNAAAILAQVGISNLFDTGCRHDHLLGQDRHSDDERDDGTDGAHQWRPVRGQWIGLRPIRRGQAGR